jgi:hypothetical protein
MNENLSFADPLMDEREHRIAQLREHYTRIHLEGLQAKFKHIEEDVKGAEGYFRSLIRSGVDVSKELNEFTDCGLSIVARANRLAGEAVEPPSQFWTE